MSVMMRRLLKILAPLAAVMALFAVASPAQAACDALSLCSCHVSTTGLAFSDYNPLLTPDVENTGTIRVQCTLLVALPGSYTIELSTGSSGTYTQRTMTRTGSSLGYNLYSDAARTQVWGSGATKMTRTFLALLALDQSTTVYGRIPHGQTATTKAGLHQDTVIVTITY
jgi:spore coat protein U-like protein